MAYMVGTVTTVIEDSWGYIKPDTADERGEPYERRRFSRCELLPASFGTRGAKVGDRVFFDSGRVWLEQYAIDAGMKQLAGLA